MKKLNVLLALLLVLPAVKAAAKDKDDGSVALPDTELIDVPTAGILDYYGFLFKSRFYSDGGLLGAINFGVQERLNLGASMTVDKLVGSDDPISLRQPQILVKYRFYDGGYYIPALAVGYDGQGYYYNSTSKKYMEKGRGLYLVGSKEVLLPGLSLHGGFNVSDFDREYLYGFLAASYTLEDQVAFMAEYDNLFHSDNPSRLNVGMRLYITPYFQLDAAVRELGRSGYFSNGLKRRAERIVQMRYNTSF